MGNVKKILLSNDDGIYAPGIKILRDLLEDLGHQVRVVAPAIERSATSHSVTISQPLIAKKVKIKNKFFGMAVEGFPADSVRLGIMNLYPDTDMVFTGINCGINAGPSIYYSGTVAAAFEGHLAGLPSVAMSLATFRAASMEKLSTLLKPFMADIVEQCNFPGLFNVNIPDAKKINGIKLARQSMGQFLDQYVKRKNPRGTNYYWLTSEGISQEPETAKKSSKDSLPNDIDVLKEGYISLTPLQFDLTNYEQLSQLEHNG